LDAACSCANRSASRTFWLRISSLPDPTAGWLKKYISADHNSLAQVSIALFQHRFKLVSSYVVDAMDLKLSLKVLQDQSYRLAYLACNNCSKINQIANATKVSLTHLSCSWEVHW